MSYGIALLQLEEKKSAQGTYQLCQSNKMRLICKVEYILYLWVYFKVVPSDSKVH